MEVKTIGLIVIIGLLLYFTMEVPACVLIEEEELIESTESTAIIQTSVLKEIETEIDEKGYIVVSTKGNSMKEIKSCSRCLCQQQLEYHVGEIVLFYRQLNGEAQGIAHQIVYEDELYFQTRGTNNAFLDKKIPKNSVLCAIPFVKRYELFT